jgi:hypothetical protein
MMNAGPFDQPQRLSPPESRVQRLVGHSEPARHQRTMKDE